MALGKNTENLSIDQLQEEVDNIQAKSQEEKNILHETIEKRSEQNHEDNETIWDNNETKGRVEHAKNQIDIAIKKSNFQDLFNSTEYGQEGEFRPDFDGSRNKEGPDIYFKRVYKPAKEMPWYERAKDRVLGVKRDKVETDEVLMVVSMNNFDKELLSQLKVLEEEKDKAQSENDTDTLRQKASEIIEINKQISEQNTIVTALVKHENGVPQFNHEEGGLYGQYSEATFRERSSKGQLEGKCGERYLRGEVTYDKYKEEFKKENGINHKRYLKKRDRTLRRERSPLDKAEADKLMQETLLIKQERYSSLLEETAQHYQEAVIHTEEEVELIEGYNIDILTRFLNEVGTDNLKDYEEAEDDEKGILKDLFVLRLTKIGVDISSVDVDAIISEAGSLQEALDMARNRRSNRGRGRR
jgi:hypothetical protein